MCKFIETTVNFDISSFLHLSGLEKLRDLPLIERNPSSSSIYDFIISKELSYGYVCNSNSWNKPLNDPRKNGVTYTLDDRITTLTNFREVLNSGNVKVYTWNSDCHRTHRPYSSEIAADFMLVFEPKSKILST